MIEIMFDGCLLVTVFSGIFVAHKLNDSYPFWVRVLCLAPAIAAMIVLWSIIAGLYTATVLDVILAFCNLGCHIMIASRFTSKPVLDLRRTSKYD
jgi:hypothetical protein